jgi:hypothetical protein
MSKIRSIRELEIYDFDIPQKYAKKFMYSMVLFGGFCLIGAFLVLIGILTLYYSFQDPVQRSLIARILIIHAIQAYLVTVLHVFWPKAEDYIKYSLVKNYLRYILHSSAYISYFVLAVYFSYLYYLLCNITSYSKFDEVRDLKDAFAILHFPAIVALYFKSVSWILKIRKEIVDELNNGKNRERKSAKNRTMPKTKVNHEEKGTEATTNSGSVSSPTQAPNPELSEDHNESSENED